MGIWQNSRLLSDEFASNGYFTLLLDTFNGDPLPVRAVVNDEVDIVKWLAGAPRVTTHIMNQLLILLFWMPSRF
jgi:hypothetical protein